MTQAISTNIVNNLSDNQQSFRDVNSEDIAAFQQAFEKSMTLADVRKTYEEKFEDASTINDVIAQAAGELNVESSLDLTLARDINEIINDLKSAADEEIDTESADTSLFAIAENTKLSLPESNTAEDSIQLSQKPVYETVKPVQKSEEVTDSLENTETSLDEDMLKELNIESVETQADSSSQGDSLLQQQSPQEQAVKIMINHDVETFEVKLSSQAPSPSAKPVNITPEKIIEQITKQMESMNNTSKVNIVLNPESLGKVNVQLINTKEGLSAQFTVTTQEARDLLMKGLDGLKDNLISHGVGVDNVSVKVSDTQKSEYNSDWTEQEGSRGGNKGQGESRKEKEKGLFEKTMKDLNES